jgi:hypothetical protein
MACLVWAAPASVEAATGIVKIKPDGSDEDAEEYSGTLTYNSNDLDMSWDDWLADTMKIGIRFKNIQVPQGAAITKAFIRFEANQSDSGVTNLTIWGEAHDSPGDFSGGDFGGDVSARTKTTSSVAWNSIPAWTSGDRYRTADISTIVQEIVNRGHEGNPGNWASGNHMVFIIEGTGERVAKSYDGSSSDAPMLRIEYTSTIIDVSPAHQNDDAEEQPDGDVKLSSGDLDIDCDGYDKVGIRFPNVQVPQGVQITNAYIEFQADESDSSSTNMKFYGEAIDDAPRFSTSKDDIGHRNKTGQYVEWNPVPAWSVGNYYQTPDLSVIVQEIIGRGGWASGNDMVIIIDHSSGERVAESYDGNGTPPRLHIEYSDDPKPVISVDDSSVGASAYVGSSPAAATFTLTNAGSAAMSYTLTDDADAGGVDWLAVSPASGTLAAGASATVTLTFTTSALSVGTYTADITITDASATNSPFEVGVSVTLNPLPAGSACGQVPVYTENLVSPAILIEMDLSGSMNRLMPVSDPETDPKTPDLSTIVQEIVNRAGWVSGNAMAFIIVGSGERVAVSYDQSPGASTLLHVEYMNGLVTETIDLRVSQSSDDAEETSTGSISITILPVVIWTCLRPITVPSASVSRI